MKPKHWRFVLFVYAVFMIWMMFFRLRSGVWEDSSDYWEHVTTQYNLVPFHMIVSYTRVLLRTLKQDGFTWSYQLWAVCRNLFGNIGMLIPLGFLLPASFPRLRRPGKTLLAVTGIIVFLELAQLFTIAGHCDIDDLILNLLGAAMGYGLFSLLRDRLVKE